MYMQLWMSTEPQSLHNGMVYSPTVTQAFSWLSKSGSTRAVVMGCQWFHILVHCTWSSWNTLYVLHIDVHSALDGYGASTTSSVTQAFSRLSKSGSTRAVVMGCWWFHMPIHCIWSGWNPLYVLHIDVQAALDGYGASTNGLKPSSDPSFQPTAKIWINKGSGNGLPMNPYHQK